MLGVEVRTGVGEQGENLPGQVSPDEGRELALDAVPKTAGPGASGKRKLLEGEVCAVPPACGAAGPGSGREGRKERRACAHREGQLRVGGEATTPALAGLPLRQRARGLCARNLTLRSGTLPGPPTPFLSRREEAGLRQEGQGRGAQSRGRGPRSH